jgi:spore coat protein U-like protein
MPVMLIVRFVATAMLAMACWISPSVDRAAAQSCSLSVTNINFGAVDVTTNPQVDVTGTATVTCTNVVVTLGVCVNFGPGSAGATNAASRFLTLASSLNYGLFSDAGHSTPWGADNWAGGEASPVPISVLPDVSTVVTTRPIYARLHPGTPTATAGSYQSVFGNVDAYIRYGPASGIINCELLSSTATTSFSISASVAATCRIAASTLDFGNVGVLASNHDASTNLGPTCTNGTPYSIGLDGGLFGAADPTQRRMTKAAESVIYGLYRDAARSLPFGNTIGTDTLSGVGSGQTQSVLVYGRVAPQTTPIPGTYTDTVVATITY